MRAIAAGFPVDFSDVDTISLNGDILGNDDLVAFEIVALSDEHGAAITKNQEAGALDGRAGWRTLIS